MIIETINELRNYLEEHRKTGKTIGFVPTMGFLHEGHLSLIRAAKAENDVVVVSDFVNPTQFAPNEDFESYPRNIEQDEKMAMEAGADVIFFPSVEEMYPNGSSTFVEVEGEMTKILCGKSRPSHFKGVTTVVNILFKIVQPNKAYFGQKDAQQAAVLMKMVRDLHQNLEIVVCPIVREKDGLAMSSRNTYLDTQQRKDATILYQSLQEAELHFKNGENNVGNLTQFIRKKLSEKSSADIDYIEIYDFPSLTKIEKIDHKALAAIAVRFGKTRLIDNIILEKK